MRLLILWLLIVVSLASAKNKRCNSSEDCEDDECCIAKSFLLYRKGDCRKLAQKGDSCSEDDESIGFLHEQYIGHCPCDLGLSCQPTQVKDLPFIGTVRYDEKCVEDVSTTTATEPET
ncbi:hypothetical protein HNY73_002859 [Argiope bruennichi]|uniref:Prokineticin domain-containing protein n=1 Tax=Argiope bruennichi TaxID=94029 RepID=A0A8T0FV35_ARGBR|nr:hypothetical protein HNY73_002859 [Argiope bruennichi]